MRTKPFELQYLENLQKRVRLNRNEYAGLLSLKRGYHGEISFDKLVCDYFGSPELVLDDINLCCEDEVVQIDKIIITTGTAYIIDVKNYRGEYCYRENGWYFNGKIMSHNIFRQIDRAHDILEKIFVKTSVNLQIERVLVFMDPGMKLEIKQQLVQKVKTFGEVPSWLLDLQNTVGTNSAKLQSTVSMVTGAFNRYEIKRYRPLNDLGSHKLKTGIMCPKCGNFSWQQQRKYFQCSCCHFCEAKERAYVRTICEYGVLFFKHHLARGDLRWFMGGIVNDNYLKYILHKYFTLLHNKGRYSVYQNEGKQFEDWFSDKKSYFDQLQSKFETSEK